jgi:hypothetical protein
VAGKRAVGADGAVKDERQVHRLQPASGIGRAVARRDQDAEHLLLDQVVQFRERPFRESELLGDVH